MDDAQQRFHANRTVRADEVGWVSVDDLERWHGHERAFLKSATRGLQSPKFRRGWSFSEGQHGIISAFRSLTPSVTRRAEHRLAPVRRAEKSLPGEPLGWVQAQTRRKLSLPADIRDQAVPFQPPYDFHVNLRIGVEALLTQRLD